MRRFVFILSAFLLSWHYPMEKEGVVTTEQLNVRKGPGMTYPVIGTVFKDENVSIIAAFGRWYLVCLKDGSVGVVSNSFIKIQKITDIELSEGDMEERVAEEEIPSDPERLFQMVNEERQKESLPLFVWDAKLNRIAQLKADDMIENAYFGHESPDYGTPFSMLKDMGVVYKTASENIGKDISVEEAHKKIMDSIAHKANVMSPRYNKMGVGVGMSPRNPDELIIVQLFVEDIE